MVCGYQQMQPVPLCICWSIWYEETHERLWAYSGNWHLYLHNMKQNSDEHQIWSTLLSKENLFLADQQHSKVKPDCNPGTVVEEFIALSVVSPAAYRSLVTAWSALWTMWTMWTGQLGWGSEVVVLKAHQRVGEQVDTCSTLVKTIKCTTLVIVEVEDVWQRHFTLIEHKQKF